MHTNKIVDSFNFKQYPSYDVDQIVSIIKNFDDEWKIDTSRQDKYHTHVDTESYFIYKADLQWESGKPFVTELVAENQELVDLIEPIISDLEEIHNGKRGNVLFIKLLGGRDIPKHFDGGDYLIKTRRHHVPIITSEDTWFGVSREEKQMQVGECWEINNAKPHYVNNGEQDRVHLLIDIMPVEEMEQ